MAVESIGSLYPTKIPGLADAADIQAALRAYHYGSYTYSTANTSPASLEANSIAKFLYDIETDIAALEARPSSGGNAQNTQPAPADFSPADVPDGYIWVDADGSVSGLPTSATSVFTDSVPTTSLTTGLIWVDKDASGVVANPYIATSAINAKGDLFAGSANDAVTTLTVGTNGYLLAASSATTSGLVWTNVITSPIISGTTTTASGNLAVLPATYILEVQGGASTEGAIQLNCAVNSHGQKIKSQPHSESATNTLLLPGGSTIGNANATLVSNTGTQTLTNKTLTSPVLISPEERTSVSTSAPTATTNLDIVTAGTHLFTANSTSNVTLNIRGDGSTTLNSLVATGDSITVVALITNGATAYYPNVIQIDGNTVTPKYQGGTAPTAGNASSIDAYVFSIIKTASATFTVLASQTKFA